MEIENRQRNRFIVSDSKSHVRVMVQHIQPNFKRSFVPGSAQIVVSVITCSQADELGSRSKHSIIPMSVDLELG
ncbi:hypothetical protein AV540_02270 [Brevibacillus parabrevis]|nr:hypothetical protein AV540_02270 [Brevibacillus parabrevis]